jgi:hypothetical protein
LFETVLLNTVVNIREQDDENECMLRTVDQKHLKSSEMWCWRRIVISWTDHVRNEEVLLRAEEYST